MELSEIMYRVGGELIPGLAVPSGPDEVIVTRGKNGHFFINGRANGKLIRFMVDTGATRIMLSPGGASQIGIDPDDLNFTQRYLTANGIGLGAPYTLKSFSIGPLEFKNVEVSINKAEMSNSLLGMSFLEKLQSFEFRSDKLYLRK